MDQGAFLDKELVKPEKFGVFVFDTALSGKDTTLRQSAAFWNEFCKASKWNFMYERIHSLADLKYFLVDRKTSHPILIFNGHGGKESGWIMSNGDVLNDKTFDFTPDDYNKNKIVIFSACEIGKNKGMCNKLKELFCAEALFAYNCTVHDNICFLLESLLLTYIKEDYKTRKLAKHYEYLVRCTKRIIKTNYNLLKSNPQFLKNHHTFSKTHPLVMY